MPEPGSNVKLLADIQEFVKNCREAGRKLGESFAEVNRKLNNFYATMLPKTDEDWQELRSIRRYEAEVERQRRIGRAYVRAQAARVRKELGLGD